jgi:outer membrane cobalamin receptor
VSLAFFPALAGAAPAVLRGTVLTPTGEPLPHLPLLLSGPETRRVLTGPAGRFEAEGLPPGAYTVGADVPGFVLFPEGAVDVAGETRREFTLRPAPVREHLVVSATRSEAAHSTLGISAFAIDAERLEATVPTDVVHALDQVPGVAVARAGGVGLQASAFVRGGESRFARVLVDGVPVNDVGGAYNFGTALPLELERMEVVRGAASSLYGTDALAGVVQLVTRRAAPGDAPSVHGEAEGGSFAWQRYLLGTTGRRGWLDWNAGVQRAETDNEQPNSAFEQTAGAVALGAGLGTHTLARLVLRAEDAAVGTPGPTAYGRPDLDASSERQELALGATLRHAPGNLAHELRLGLAQTDQLSRNPLDSGPWLPTLGDLTAAFPRSDSTSALGFANDSERLLVSYQLDAQAGDHLVSGGVDFERETGESGDRSETLLAGERNNYGAWAQGRVALGTRAFLTVGGRVEHNDSFGTEAVPRAALAVRVRGGADATTLRASAGAGIKEPSFFESFSPSPFARGNPDLKPERSRTYDLGIEQRLFDGRLRAEVTGFHHDYRDQIAFHFLDFTTFEATFINLGHTRGRGIEVALEAAPAAWARFWGEYTFLDGEVLVSSSDFDPVYEVGRELLRRPRHQGSLGVWLEQGRVGLGATVSAVGARADSDFVGLGLTENEGHARVDARARVRLGRGFWAQAAADNLFDSEYEEVLGYPALGRALRVSLAYRGGERRP